jgi:hypothetical protein
LGQHYLAIERANTVLTNITVWQQMGTKLLLAGMNKDEKNILSFANGQYAVGDI